MDGLCSRSDNIAKGKKDFMNVKITWKGILNKYF
jgi:hypothetical protein